MMITKVYTFIPTGYDMASCLPSSQLQNANKYCTKVRRRVKTGNRSKFDPVLPRITKVEISYEHPLWRNDSHIGHDVTSYFRSAVTGVQNAAENAVYDRLMSNFNSAAFCLAQPIGGLLVFEKLGPSQARKLYEISAGQIAWAIFN